MSPTDDTPLVARLARWSEWWFTPRWRALLTWLLFSMLSSAAFESLLFSRLDLTLRLRFRSNAMHWSPILLSVHYADLLYFTIRGVNFALIAFWLEPLALRLSSLRSAVWFASRFIPGLVVYFVDDIFPSMNRVESLACYKLLPAVTMMLALRGWRSRPWMCLVAPLASEAIGELTVSIDANIRQCFFDGINTLAFAATLLYGTRLLRPEERTASLISK